MNVNHQKQQMDDIPRNIFIKLVSLKLRFFSCKRINKLVLYFTAQNNSIGHMTPKQEKRFWLISGVTDLSYSGVNTTTHAGAKMCAY
jgi:hypothetical protein